MPPVNNLVVIAAAGIFLLLPSTSTLTPATISTAQVTVLGIGTLLGVAVQTAGLWPAARRVGLRWRWRFDLHALHLGHLARLAGWLLCFVAVGQVGVLVVLALVKAAGDRGAPGVFIYNNGWLMLMMGATASRPCPSSPPCSPA
ncbi:MAG: hypothetical protein KJO75_08365 [Dactylosporangium sp.]|nr:hypothetical protein [Dactylosporangium sp.]